MNFDVRPSYGTTEAGELLNSYEKEDWLALFRNLIPQDGLVGRGLEIVDGQISVSGIAYSQSDRFFVGDENSPVFQAIDTNHISIGTPLPVYAPMAILPLDGDHLDLVNNKIKLPASRAALGAQWGTEIVDGQTVLIVPRPNSTMPAGLIASQEYKVLIESGYLDNEFKLKNDSNQVVDISGLGSGNVAVYLKTSPAYSSERVLSVNGDMRIVGNDAEGLELELLDYTGPSRLRLYGNALGGSEGDVDAWLELVDASDIGNYGQGVRLGSKDGHLIFDTYWTGVGGRGIKASFRKAVQNEAATAIEFGPQIILGGETFSGVSTYGQEGTKPATHVFSDIDGQEGVSAFAHSLGTNVYMERTKTSSNQMLTMHSHTSGAGMEMKKVTSVANDGFVVQAGDSLSFEMIPNGGGNPDVLFTIHRAGGVTVVNFNDLPTDPGAVASGTLYLDLSDRTLKVKA
jgi:hypothetical protein